MRRKSIAKSIKLCREYYEEDHMRPPWYTSLQCGIQHFCWSRLLWIACCNGLTMRGFDTNSVEAEGRCKEGRMKSALMFANQSEEIVWNWDTNTNSTVNCLKHAVFNCEFIICHPGYHDAVPFLYINATQYPAPKARHQCLLDYHHPEFLFYFFGGASGSTRKKTFLVVQLRAWPWILSKLIQVVVYVKYVTNYISRTYAMA